MSHHNSFVMTVNAALGGGKSQAAAKPPRAGDAGVKDLSAGHNNVDAAVAAINAALLF